MKFSRKTNDHVLVIGVFQGSETGRAVLKMLRRARFHRAAAIRVSPKGKRRIEEIGASAFGGSVVAALLGLAAGALFSWQRGMEEGHSALLPLLMFLTSGALAGWAFIRLRQQRVASANVNRYARLILQDEMVVLAEVEAGDTERLLAVLRNVGTEPPATFAFHPPASFAFTTPTRLLWPERPSNQRLAENAARLAHEITVNREAKPRGPSFLRRLGEVEQALGWANASLTMSAEVHHAFTLSAEWLLDNAYLIREQMTEMRQSLPRKYYDKLPLIAAGAEAGRPRIYRVATEIVAESGGALDAEIVQKFLDAFQTGHAARHRRTLGHAPDVAAAVARVP